MTAPAEDGGDVEYGDIDPGDEYSSDGEPDGNDDEDTMNDDDDELDSFDIRPTIPIEHRRMIKRVKIPTQDRKRVDGEVEVYEQLDVNPLQMMFASLPTTLPNLGKTSTTADDMFSASQTGVENAKKTEKPKGKKPNNVPATKTKGSGGTCTPSPTKSLAPSASK